MLAGVERLEGGALCRPVHDVEGRLVQEDAMHQVQLPATQSAPRPGLTPAGYVCCRVIVTGGHLRFTAVANSLPAASLQFSAAKQAVVPCMISGNHRSSVPFPILSCARASSPEDLSPRNFSPHQESTTSQALGLGTGAPCERPLQLVWANQRDAPRGPWWLHAMRLR